jgi:glycosyltransferase involved in cell wall biosynthesis
VRRQTYPNWELVIVDDCSEDDTWAWLLRVSDPRVRAVRLGRHSERSAARNYGLEIARGDHVLFLDDDDRLSPRALDHLVRSLEQHLDAAFAAGARIAFDSFGNRQSAAHPRISFLRRRPWRDTLVGWASSQGATLFRAHALRAAGGWNERLVGAEDHELLLRIGLRGACAVVSQVVLECRVHGAQWRARDTAVIEEEFRREFVNRLVGHDRQLGERLLKVRMLLALAMEDYRRGRFLPATGLILEAVREEPSVLWSPLTGPGILALWLKTLAGLVVGPRVFAGVRNSWRRLRRARRHEVVANARVLERSARIDR